MTSQSVLTVVSVRDDALRRVLAHHLARTGIHLIVDDGRDALQRRAVRAPTILLTGESRFAHRLHEAIADGWAVRAWQRVMLVAVDGDRCDAEPARLRAIFSEWDENSPPPDNSVDAPAWHRV